MIAVELKKQCQLVFIHPIIQILVLHLVVGHKLHDVNSNEHKKQIITLLPLMCGGEAVSFPRDSDHSFK